MENTILILCIHTRQKIYRLTDTDCYEKCASIFRLGSLSSVPMPWALILPEQLIYTFYSPGNVHFKIIPCFGNNWQNTHRFLRAEFFQDF